MLIELFKSHFSPHRKLNIFRTAWSFILKLLWLKHPSSLSGSPFSEFPRVTVMSAGEMLEWRNYRHKSPVERHRKSLFLSYFYSDRRAILSSECVRGY